MSKFKVGDRVSWMGAKGTIREITEFHLPDDRYPVVVYFDDDKKPYYFTLDGRYWDFHTKPSLKLLNKKANAEVYLNLYAGDALTYYYKSRKVALAWAIPNAIEKGVRFIRAKDQKLGKK